MEHRSRLSLLMIILLLLLSACDMSRDAQLDLEHPDDKLIAEKLVIWWDEEYGPPYQSFGGNALMERFKETHFEFRLFTPPTISDHRQESLFNMLRAETSPDLIIFDSRYLSLLIDAEYLAPIPDMYGLEMDSDMVSEIRSAAYDLSIYALPYGRVVGGLYYNKAIFDQYQVPYPTDGMTWGEVTSLAQQFKNIGLNPLDITNLHQLASQVPFHDYDPETGHFEIIDLGWEQMTNLLLSINELDVKTKTRSMSSFGVGGSAMVAGPLFGNDGLHINENNLNGFGVDWDVASYPVFHEDGILPTKQMLLVGVPIRSNYQEDAYKVLRYLLSGEIQVENNRKGLASLRGDAATMIEEFGSASLLAGRSVSSFFVDTPRGTHDMIYEFSQNYNIMVGFLWDEGILDKDPGIVKKAFRDNISEYVQQRASLISEIKSKF